MFWTLCAVHVNKQYNTLERSDLWCTAGHIGILLGYCGLGIRVETSYTNNEDSPIHYKEDGLSTFQLCMNLIQYSFWYGYRQSLFRGYTLRNYHACISGGTNPSVFHDRNT